MPKMALRNIFRRRVSSLSQYKNEGVVLEKKSLIIATLGLLLMACSLLNLRHGFSDDMAPKGGKQPSATYYKMEPYTSVKAITSDDPYIRSLYGTWVASADQPESKSSEIKVHYYHTRREKHYRYRNAHRFLVPTAEFSLGGKGFEFEVMDLETKYNHLRKPQLKITNEGHRLSPKTLLEANVDYTPEKSGDYVFGILVKDPTQETDADLRFVDLKTGKAISTATLRRRRGLAEEWLLENNNDWHTPIVTVPVKAGVPIRLELSVIGAGANFKVAVKGPKDAKHGIISLEQLSQPRLAVNSKTIELRDRYYDRMKELQSELTPHFKEPHASLVNAFANKEADRTTASREFVDVVATEIVDEGTKRKLIELRAIRETSPDALARYASQSKAAEGFVEDLLADHKLLSVLLNSGEGAAGHNILRAALIYGDIVSRHPKAERKGTIENRLALAVALDYADAAIIHEGSLLYSGIINPLDRYDFFLTSFENGMFFPGFELLDVFELQLTVRSNLHDDVLRWGQEYLKTHHLDFYNWKDSVHFANWDTKGGSAQIYPGHNVPASIMMSGSKCGGVAGNSRFFSAIVGVPHAPRPQKKHASNVFLRTRVEATGAGQTQLIHEDWGIVKGQGRQGVFGKGAEVVVINGTIPDHKFLELAHARQSEQYASRVQMMRAVTCLIDEPLTDRLRSLISGKVVPHVVEPSASPADREQALQTMLSDEIEYRHGYAITEDSEALLEAIDHEISSLAKDYKKPAPAKIEILPFKSRPKAPTMDLGDVMPYPTENAKHTGKESWDRNGVQSSSLTFLDPVMQGSPGWYKVSFQTVNHRCPRVIISLLRSRSKGQMYVPRTFLRWKTIEADLYFPKGKEPLMIETSSGALRNVRIERMEPQPAEKVYQRNLWFFKEDQSELDLPHWESVSLFDKSPDYRVDFYNYFGMNLNSNWWRIENPAYSEDPKSQPVHLHQQQAVHSIRARMTAPTEGLYEFAINGRSHNKPDKKIAYAEMWLEDEEGKVRHLVDTIKDMWDNGNITNNDVHDISEPVLLKAGEQREIQLRAKWTHGCIAEVRWKTPGSDIFTYIPDNFLEPVYYPEGAK